MVNHATCSGSSLTRLSNIVDNTTRANEERAAARKVGRGHPDHEVHLKLALWFDQQAEQEGEGKDNDG